MLLLIDNYDSFTYNLYQYIAELGADVLVRRNDALTIEEIERLQPERVVVSPGPGNPSQAGISVELIREIASGRLSGGLNRVPTLGVCLGHQCIGAAFGGRIVHASRLMHGKTSQVSHDGRGVFADLPALFTAARYHSLAVEESSLPDCLEVSAVADDGEIMGIRHRELPIEGVQFHPESILTSVGKDLLRNFLALSPFASAPRALNH